MNQISKLIVNHVLTKESSMKILLVLLTVLIMSVEPYALSLLSKGTNNGAWESECLFGNKALFSFQRGGVDFNKEKGIVRVEFDVYEGNGCSSAVAITFGQYFPYEEATGTSLALKIKRNPEILVTRKTSYIPWYISMNSCVETLVKNVPIGSTGQHVNFEECNLGKFNAKKCKYGAWCDDSFSEFITWWRAKSSRLLVIDNDTIDVRLDRYIPNIRFSRL